jgi:hypothetical protein
MAKRDMDQPEAQRGGRDREMNETRDENAVGNEENIRGIADEEEEDFDEDDVEELEEEEDEDI